MYKHLYTKRNSLQVIERQLAQAALCVTMFGDKVPKKNNWNGIFHSGCY